MFWCCSSSAHLYKFLLVSLGITERKKHGLWSIKILLLINISLYFYSSVVFFFSPASKVVLCLVSQTLKPFRDFLWFFSWSIWLCFMSVFTDNFHLKKSHGILVWNMIYLFYCCYHLWIQSHTECTLPENFLQAGEQIVGCSVQFDHEVRGFQLTAEWNIAPQL